MFLNVIERRNVHENSSNEVQKNVQNKVVNDQSSIFKQNYKNQKISNYLDSMMQE